jgi:hypothetical protein
LAHRGARATDRAVEPTRPPTTERRLNFMENLPGADFIF